MLLFCLTSTSLFSQDLSTITGPSNPKAGSSCTYTIFLEGDFSSSLEIVIASNYGCFDREGGPNRIIRYPSIVGNSITVTVYWPDIEKSDGYIIAYKKTGTGKTVEKTGIKVSKDGDGNTSDKIETLRIPPYLTEGDEFKIGYIIPNDKKRFYKIKNYEYDSRYFSLIEKSDHDITFKVIGSPNPASTILKFNIVIENRDDYIIYSYVNHRLTTTWSIPGYSIYLNPQIFSLNSDNCGCSGDVVQYIIENVWGPFVDATATWQAGTNTTLLSFGETWAKFRVSGNGSAVVNAKVTAGGKEFNLTNSSVWVGIPQMPSISNFDHYPYLSVNMNYTYDCYVAGAHNPGSEIFWNVSGDAFLLFPGKIQTKYVDLDGAFTVQVYGRNKCGTGPTLRKVGIVKNPNPGGWMPPIIEFSLPSNSMNTIENAKSYSIRIYDLSGRVVYSNKNISRELDLKTTSLYDGIYIIEKYDGENITRDKVIFKR